MPSGINRLNHLVRSPHRGRLSWTNQVMCVTLLFLGCVLLYAAQPQSARSAQENGSMSRLRSSGTVSAYAEFRTQGTNGFRIFVTGSSKGVRLVASKHHEAAIYLDRRGIADQSGIHAVFGRMGKIDLRFHALRGARRTLRQPADWTACDLKLEDKYGYFMGTVIFRGEEGFTKLHQRKVYGSAAPAQKRKCIGQSSRSAGGVSLKPTSGKQREFSTGISIPIGSSSIALRSLIAGGEAISGIRSLVRSGVSLDLAKLPSTGIPFRAESIQDYGKLVIIRLLVAKGSVDSLMVDGDQNVTVAPPSPFSGHVEYRRCAPRSTLAWSGSLRVSLPGLSNATFAGKSFAASLKPGGRCQPVR